MDKMTVSKKDFENLLTLACEDCKANPDCDNCWVHKLKIKYK